MSPAETPRPAATVTLPSDCAIVITRTFAAARADVFDAWTTPARIAEWWDPRGLPLAVCEVDLRPGGTFRFVPQGSGHAPAFSGEYREITAPERLEFATPGPSPGRSTIGTLVFEEHDGVTTLTITMTAASPADRDALLRHRVDRGTIQTLEHLAAHLAGGAPEPTDPSRRPPA